MTRTDLLLTILSEECSEVSQRISKALRFGLQEVQVNQTLHNAERIVYELSDLIAVYEILKTEGILPDVNRYDLSVKKEKVEKYLEYSKTQGRHD